MVQCSRYYFKRVRSSRLLQSALLRPRNNPGELKTVTNPLFNCLLRLDGSVGPFKNDSVFNGDFEEN